MASLEVTVPATVELSVGERTSAWLVSLGWTPPVTEVPADVTGMGSDMVVNTKVPSISLPAAHEAMNGRQAAKYQAQQDYQAMMTELSSPERLTKLLEFFGVRMDRFIPQADDSASSDA